MAMLTRPDGEIHYEVYGQGFPVLLFAPGGLFDGFVNTLLRPFVDMSGRTWRLQSTDNAAAPVSPAAPRAP